MCPEELRGVETLPFMFAVPHIPEVTDRLAGKDIHEQDENAPDNCKAEDAFDYGAEFFVRKEAEVEEKHGNLGKGDRGDVEGFDCVVELSEYRLANKDR